MNDEDILTTREAAGLLGVTPARIRVFISQGRLPAIKAGRDWSIRRDHLLALERLPVGRPPRKPDASIAA